MGTFNNDVTKEGGRGRPSVCPYSVGNMMWWSESVDKQCPFYMAFTLTDLNSIVTFTAFYLIARIDGVWWKHLQTSFRDVYKTSWYITLFCLCTYGLALGFRISYTFCILLWMRKMIKQQGRGHESHLPLHAHFKIWNENFPAFE